MKLEVVRRGGIVGLPFRGTVDTGTMPADQAQAVESAVKALRFGQPPSPARHPDSFQYEIALEQDGQRRSAVLDEADMPDALRSVVDEAVTPG
jgi:hypothetical protein